MNATAPALKRVRAGEPPYGEIVDFLNDEAALLDDDLHKEWLGCFTADVSYTIPARLTVYRRDGRGFDDSSYHFNDNWLTLQTRVRKSVEVRSAFDRDPAPRIRRMITNVVVRESDVGGEYAVTSSILLLRNRFDDPQYDILSGRREDILRRTRAGLKIAKRTVFLDQTALGACYANVFM